MANAFPPGADLSNWRTAPHSRWAFHHVADIIPTARVHGAPGAPMPSGRSAKSLEGFALRAPDGSTLDLRAFLDATATDAMVVLLDGEVVHESYAHGMAPASAHILMSATKALVGLAAGILAHAGRLDLDAVVSRFVPEVAGGPFAGATLRHLLDMRTGVVFDPAQQRAYRDATGWERVTPGAAVQGLHAFLAGLSGPPASHGGAFRYVSANTDLLGWAMERATGQDIPGLIGDLVWAPMGAEGDACITLDSDGAPRCAGGFCATALDFARLGQLIVDGGFRGETVVAPPGLIEDLFDGGDRAAWADGEWGAAFAPISRAMSYRNGWYTLGDAPRTLFAMGIHGQNLFVDRANRLVVAKFSSWREATDYAALPLTHRAVGEIRRRLAGAGRESMA